MLVDIIVSNYLVLDPIDFEKAGTDKRGLSGTEIGALSNAYELAKLGWEVRFFTVLVKEGEHQGVQFINYLSWPPQEKADVVISYMDIEPLRGAPEALKVAVHGNYILPDRGNLEGVDLHLCSSEPLAQHLTKKYSLSNCHALPVPCDFEIYYPEWKPVPGRVLYHTAVDRGLHLLLLAWPDILKQVPHATLHIAKECTKWITETIRDMSECQEGIRSRWIKERINQPGITVLGGMSREGIAQELS